MSSVAQKQNANINAALDDALSTRAMLIKGRFDRKRDQKRSAGMQDKPNTAENARRRVEAMLETLEPFGVCAGVRRLIGATAEMLVTGTPLSIAGLATHERQRGRGMSEASVSRHRTTAYRLGLLIGEQGRAGHIHEAHLHPTLIGVFATAHQTFPRKGSLKGSLNRFPHSSLSLLESRIEVLESLAPPPAAQVATASKRTDTQNSPPPTVAERIAKDREDEQELLAPLVAAYEDRTGLLPRCQPSALRQLRELVRQHGKNLVREAMERYVKRFAALPVVFSPSDPDWAEEWKWLEQGLRGFVNDRHLSIALHKAQADCARHTAQARPDAAPAATPAASTTRREDHRPATPTTHSSDDPDTAARRRERRMAFDWASTRPELRQQGDEMIGGYLTRVITAYRQAHPEQNETAA